MAFRYDREVEGPDLDFFKADPGLYAPKPADYLSKLVQKGRPKLQWRRFFSALRLLAAVADMGGCPGGSVREHVKVGYRSGQTGQTVNLLA